MSKSSYAPKVGFGVTHSEALPLPAFCLSAGQEGLNALLWGGLQNLAQLLAELLLSMPETQLREPLLCSTKIGALYNTKG